MNVRDHITINNVTKMKKVAIIFFGIVFILLGCNREDYSPYSYSNEATIYSETNNTMFRELLVILKPYIEFNDQKKYIITDIISNVVIKINDKDWGKFNSLNVDTSLFIYEIYNDYYATDDIIKYSVIAPYQTSKDTLTTAGEYSDLLNNFFTLEPGFYICEIESFEIKLINGNKQMIKPFIVIPIEIKQNTRSSFIGEFDILVN